jgi:hypothetical protein
MKGDGAIKTWRELSLTFGTLIQFVPASLVHLPGLGLEAEAMSLHSLPEATSNVLSNLLGSRACQHRSTRLQKVLCQSGGSRLCHRKDKSR